MSCFLIMVSVMEPKLVKDLYLKFKKIQRNIDKNDELLFLRIALLLMRLGVQSIRIKQGKLL